MRKEITGKSSDKKQRTELMMGQTLDPHSSNQKFFYILFVLAFFLIGFQTLVSVPLGLFDIIFDNPSFFKLVIAVVVAIVMIGVGFIIIRWFSIIRWPWERRDLHNLWHYMYSAILIGLILRLAFVAFTDVSPESDAKVYMDLGRILANGQPYYFADRWAYWPVGFPLVLSLWFRAFGSALLGLQILNILLFILTCFGINKLAKVLALPKAGLLAVWLFALWPDLVVLTSYPSKELLASALIPWMMALYLSSYRSLRSSIIFRVSAGIITGALVLVQPSFMLFIPALAVSSVLLKWRNFREMIFDVLLVGIAASVIVMPWTIRNYYVLGEFVPVSTNGGEVLYRANNPLATGGYIKKGEVDLWDMPELEAHHTGNRLAKAWIVENPSLFLKLAFQKQILFLGDDSIGFYEVFRRGKAGPPLPEHLYYAGKLFCTAYWYLLWSLFTASLIYIVIKKNQKCLVPLFAALPFLYLYAIHSIFESGPRYHQPASSIIILSVSATILIAIQTMRNGRAQ